jgi:hypothetical protein
MFGASPSSNVQEEQSIVEDLWQEMDTVKAAHKLKKQALREKHTKATNRAIWSNQFPVQHPRVFDASPMRSKYHQ